MAKRRNSRKRAAARPTSIIDPNDIKEPPRWDPLSWLRDFARDEVWPFVDAQRRALKTALDRWLGTHAEADEGLRQRALLEQECRRLDALGPDYEQARQALLKQLEAPFAYNAEPLDLPLPPPADRTLSPNACLVAMMAVNDETRDPSQRIGPTDCGLYSAVCFAVRQLEEKHLPALRAMLQTASTGPEWKEQQRSGNQLEEAPTPRPQPAEQISAETRAIAFILDAQRQRKRITQINFAEAVGKDRSIFIRNPTLRAVWQAYKDSFRMQPPPGFVDQEGNVDAIDPDSRHRR